MKILQVATSYYPRIGGLEYVVKSVSERLVKIGHEVTVIAGEPGIDRPREEEINGVKIIRWPVWSPSGAYHFPKRRKELEGLLRNVAEKVDIVHVHSIHTIFTVYSGLMVLNNSQRKKVIVTPHYHGEGHSALRRLLWIPWRHRVSELLEKASIVHSVSGREASLVAFHFPSIRGKISVIQNGVDEDAFYYKWTGQDSDYMIYAGRIERYKRIELAIEIAKELNLKLLVLGQGPYKNKLERYAEENYRGMVNFFDHQPREIYLEMLSKARYAINPSKHEAYSIFVAEALAMGTPATASREIGENLEAQTKPFGKDLVILEKASIKTWNEVLQLYQNKLYE
jgi:glycosyltransferase involved in cell wall biosynthesis